MASVNEHLSCLKIAHSNINSIRNKVDSVSAELSDFDIICIGETKLNDQYPTSELAIDGFKVPYRKDRLINNGGGLLVYVKNSICCKRRQDLEDNYCENIWLEVQSLRKRFLIGLFYRPPNSTIEYWDALESNIEKVSEDNLDLLILGDFNQDILNLNPNSQLFRIMSKFNLQNIIKEPTRITPTTETCLDLIMTNHLSIINDFQVLPPFNSDHCTVTAEITFKTYKQQAFKRFIWKYEEANIGQIENELENMDWSFIQNLDDINHINDLFTTKIMEICNKSIPCTTATIRPNDKPWMNNQIRKLMRQRNRLYTKAKIKKSDMHWRNYRSKRNEVIEKIRLAKKDYFLRLKQKLSEEDLPTRSWYKIANEITKIKNKNNPTPPLLSDDSVKIHPIDKAETLNQHFTNISSLTNEPPLPEETIPDYNLSFITVTEQDVVDQIHILNASKPSGPDELMPRLIKIIGKYLIKPLTLLYNKSLSLGEVPQQWKMANVSAIFKGKGDEHDPTNYRPISVTSCLGKMLEKIIFKYLFNYLQDFEILTKYQSGFRPRDSTVNQLLEIYNIIIENLDKGKDVRFIFCDVSKAFDKVWHNGLLFKLKKYGICGSLINWFSSYLSDRKQRVIQQGFHSTWTNTSAGVPQGSVLGPYLFLLYINDIVDNIKSNIRLFADDTSLFTVIDDENSVNILSEDLYQIASWSQNWCVILNPNKTKSILFTRKRTHIMNQDIKYNNNTIAQEKTHTHLGITLSSDATWGDHISRVYEKAALRLNILRMLKYDLDRKSLSRFYLSYIRPILEYGNIIWDACTQQQSNLLESIQLDAARIITGLRRGTSHSILYAELGWSSLTERRKNSKLIHFYKILNNETPSYLNAILDRYNQHQTEYTLRNQNLRYPVPRTTSFKNSFFPSTIDAWNNLDDNLNNATSLYDFKKVLKQRILKPPVYFEYGKRKENILLCQLRNFKSQLNLDLYNDHLSDSPSCSCGAPRESTNHYLLECPNYKEQRQELIDILQLYPTIYETITISSGDLLQGNSNLNKDNNCILLDSVMNYINKSNRFN